jgi:hypothetical protein
MSKTAPESFLPLKPHWVHILPALAGRENHGYGIMRDALDRTAGKVRLRPAPERNIERRRYYRITGLVRRVLAAESRRLAELVRIVHTKRGLSLKES